MKDPIHYLINENTLKQYCGEKKSLLHPNRISALGGLSTLTGTLALSNTYTAPIGVLGIIIGDIFADLYDGKLANKFNLKTIEGAKLDPLFDKIKNIGMGSYVGIVEGVSNPLTWFFAGSIASDIISQRQRGPLLEQIIEAWNAVQYPENCILDDEVKSNLRSNIFGKIKTGTQAGVHITYSLKETGLFNLVHENVETGMMYLMSGALATSIVLGSIGIYKRLK